MVFADDNYVKKTKITNLDEIKWDELIGQRAHDLSKKIIRFKLLDYEATINVIISSVVDNNNNYWIQGRFYDDGRFYFIRMWAYYDNQKNFILDKVYTEFIPWPDSNILDLDMDYINYQKTGVLSEGMTILN